MITQTTMRRRIRAYLDQARNNPLWDLGLNWYEREAFELNSADNLPVSVITALLSPRLSWARNKEAAYALMDGAPKPGGVLARSWRAAQLAWQADGHIRWSARALKTRAFAQLLYSPLDPVAVCLDVWALRCVGLSDDFRLTPSRYAYVAGAFRAVASQANLRPSQVQAISWCSIRGRP